MKKIKGTVTESIIIQKEVEIEVPDGSTKEYMEAAIRAKAYETTILDGDHGWEGIETSGVEVSIESEVKASYPDGRCPDCGQMIDDSVEDGEECSNCGHVFCLGHQNS